LLVDFWESGLAQAGGKLAACCVLHQSLRNDLAAALQPVVLALHQTRVVEPRNGANGSRTSVIDLPKIHESVAAKTLASIQQLR
jgi:hypothetical protein